MPQVDASDPAAGFLATLSTLDPAQRDEALSAAAAGEQGVSPDVAESAETRLALARGRIVTGDLAGAEAVLAELAAGDPGGLADGLVLRAAAPGGRPARGTPGPRSTPCATRCPASWRPSSRSGWPPRPQGTSPPPSAIFSSC